MIAPSHTLRVFSDESYFHPQDGAWAVRRVRWGMVGVRLPVEAEAVLDEFDRRSRAFNQGAPMPVGIDDAHALGRGAGHTSRVRFVAEGPSAGRKTLVVYVQSRPRSLGYALCHEVAHNLLYADGLTRLEAPADATDDDVALISQLSTSTSHPLVARRLEHCGWRVVRHEAARAERFLKAVALGRANLSERAAALVAAEFTVVLGHFWLHGARSALRRLGPYVETFAREFLPDLEACASDVGEAEAARLRLGRRLLAHTEVRGVNPLVRVAGPGSPVMTGR
jgi:hypothetical protein